MIADSGTGHGRYVKPDTCVTMTRQQKLNSENLLVTSDKTPKRQQLAAAAMDDHARLRAILDTAVDGVITIDERGLIEAVNPAAECLFGYSASEMVGHNISMLMPSPHREEHDGYLTNYLRTGQRKIIGIGREVDGRRKDGSTFPLYLAVSEISFGYRRVYTGFLHDLSDVRKAEKQATQLGRILEDSVNEIFIIDAMTLKFLLVNRGALINLGYTADEMSELTPIDIKPEFTALQFAELIAPLRAGEQQLLQFETVHQRKDGSCYDVLVRLQKSNWRGIDAFVAIILDVTDRKQQETELRIRNRAIEAANEGIVIVDATKDGHPIVFVNAAFQTISGFAVDEAIGRGCEILCGHEPQRKEVLDLQNAIAQRAEFQTTILCARKNGELFWNEISIAPVRDATGSVTHIVAIMDDVSEQRRAQQERLQSERLAAIGQMVTGLAHESRNALQRAQACLDLLALELEDQPEQLELTTKTHRALNDLHRYYEEVRNYAAPINLECRPISLAKLWRNTWRDLEPVRFGRHIELHEPAIDDDKLICKLDDHRIEQVFRNIMENAIAACPDPGHLTIRCEVSEAEGSRNVRISFSDNGPGFDAESAVGVFQPFFTTKQKGTGLGMAIAKRIVEAHGGQLEINTEIESGAEIVVTLPQ